MNPSLSVILPVCNAEETLGRVVGRLLEMLPDLAGSFEILIVDDASTDQTAEIADHWRRTFPQVRVIRHGWSWGNSAAVRTGRIESRGKHVLVVGSLRDFDPREIVRQWQEANRAAFQGDSAPEPEPTRARLHRTEAAHGGLGRQREPSFLRHLRQLSEVL